MKVQQLRELIEDLPDTMEVRFASQPNWPFEYSISDGMALRVMKDTRTHRDEEPEVDITQIQDDDDGEFYPDAVFYLIENHQIGYLSGQVKNEIGW